MRAVASKTPMTTLVNGAIDLVWTTEELAASGGLGLKKKKKQSEGENRPPLDPIRVEAVTGRCDPSIMACKE